MLKTILLVCIVVLNLIILWVLHSKFPESFTEGVDKIKGAGNSGNSSLESSSANEQQSNPSMAVTESHPAEENNINITEQGPAPAAENLAPAAPEENKSQLKNPKDKSSELIEASFGPFTSEELTNFASNMKKNSITSTFK